MVKVGHKVGADAGPVERLPPDVRNIMQRELEAARDRQRKENIRHDEAKKGGEDVEPDRVSATKYFFVDKDSKSGETTAFIRMSPGEYDKLAERLGYSKKDYPMTSREKAAFELLAEEGYDVQMDGDTGEFLIGMRVSVEPRSQIMAGKEQKLPDKYRVEGGFGGPELSKEAKAWIEKNRKSDKTEESE